MLRLRFDKVFSIVSSSDVCRKRSVAATRRAPQTFRVRINNMLKGYRARERALHYSGRNSRYDTSSIHEAGPSDV
jgi:hypothetical protein